MLFECLCTKLRNYYIKFRNYLHLKQISLNSNILVGQQTQIFYKSPIVNICKMGGKNWRQLPNWT